MLSPPGNILDMSDLAPDAYTSLFPAFCGCSEHLHSQYLRQLALWDKVAAELQLQKPTRAQLREVLKGRALLWFEHLLGPDCTYEVFRREIGLYPETSETEAANLSIMKIANPGVIGTWGPSDEALTESFPWLMRHFRYITQGAFQLVDDYARSYRTEGERLGQDVNSLFNRLWFIHGLRPSIGDRLLALKSVPPTFYAVVILAQFFEGTWKAAVPMMSIFRQEPEDQPARSSLFVHTAFDLDKDSRDITTAVLYAEGRLEDCKESPWSYNGRADRTTLAAEDARRLSGRPAAVHLKSDSRRTATTALARRNKNRPRSKFPTVYLGHEWAAAIGQHIPFESTTTPTMVAPQPASKETPEPTLRDIADSLTELAAQYENRHLKRGTAL